MQVIALAVGALLYLGIQNPKLAAVAIPIVAAQERSVAPAGARPSTSLHLRWDRDSATILDATSGELIVWDASTEPRIFLLTSDELHHGRAVYLDTADELRARLFVIGKGSIFSEIPIFIGENRPAE